MAFKAESVSITSRDLNVLEPSLFFFSKAHDK
jgi:hypothetical protein